MRSVLCQLLFATIAPFGVGLYAQTQSTDPVSVTVIQEHPSSTSSAQVTTDQTWWVTLDEANHTATIVAPPTGESGGSYIPEEGAEAVTGRYCFADFAGFAGILINSSDVHFWSPSLTGFRGNDSHFTAIRLPETVTVDETEYTVTAIGDRAFAESDIAYIHIPSTVTSIGDYAFENATALAGIGTASAYELVPNSVTELGRGVFKGCTSLTRIDIGDGVRVLPEETFDGCTALKKLSLGASIERIECTISGLTDIAYHSPNPPEIAEGATVTTATVWVPEEHLAEYTAALTGSQIETFSVKPKQEKLKFYTNIAHEIGFEIKAAPWPDEGDENKYYFVYRTKRYNEFEEDPHDASAILVAYDQSPEYAETTITHIPNTHPIFRLYFSDNDAVAIYDVNVHPKATTSSVGLQYLTAGNYQLTLVTNDVTRASYTWEVEVVDGVPVDRIIINGPSAIAPGEKAQFTAQVLASKDDVTPTVTDVVWSVSDESIATIDPVTGELTAISEGEVSIFATSTDPACDVKSGMFLNVTTGSAIRYPFTQVVAKERNTSLTKDWKLIPYQNVTTDLWYFANADGTMTLTYPGAHINDRADGVADTKVKESPYDLEHPGYPYITYGGTDDHYVMYSYDIDGYCMMTEKNTPAEAFRTAFVPPVNIIKVMTGVQGDFKGITKIGDYAFAYSNVTVIDLGNFDSHIDSEMMLNNGVTEIGDYAFYNCTNFLGVPEGTNYEVVPDQVTKLGRQVFDGCSKMERMIIGDGVEEIPVMTFHDCNSLRELRLGAKVSRINCDINAKTRIVFANPVPPTIASGCQVTAPEYWVPEGSKEAYAAAGFTESSIRTYSLEVNGGEDVYACINTERTVPVATVLAPLQASTVPYHFAYDNTGTESPVIYPSQQSANRARYSVESPSASHVQITSNNLYVRYGTAGNYNLYFRTLDITRQKVKVPVHVINRAPVTSVTISKYPDGKRMEAGSSFTFVYTTNLINVKIPATWSSSNPDVIEIDPETGVATAKGYGSARIIITTTDPYSATTTNYIDIEVRPEGMASNYTAKQKHPDRDTNTATQALANVVETETEWWFHTFKPEGSAATEASIAFPEGTEFEPTFLPNGTMPAKNTYDFEWAGYQYYTIWGESAKAWHSGMPTGPQSGFGPYFFTAILVPEIVKVGQQPIAVSAIGAGAFAGSNAVNIHVHDGIYEIGDYAFAWQNDYIGLTTGGEYKAVPNSVKTIGKGLFKGCKSMTAMEIGDGVETVPEETFDGCMKLRSIGFGENVKQINCHVARSTFARYPENPNSASTSGGTAADGTESTDVETETETTSKVGRTELTEEDLKLTFDDLDYVAFRSAEPPLISSKVEFRANKIYCPVASVDRYKAAFPGIDVEGYYIEFLENEVYCYAMQDRKINFVKHTALSGATTTAHFMYPQDHNETDTDPGRLYGFTVNAFGNAGVHGEYYLMFFQDADGNDALDKIWAANRVQGSFATITWKEAGDYKFIIVAHDGTRCRSEVKVHVKDGNPVSQITITGYPGVSPGTSIQLTANVYGPRDKNDKTGLKTLEPSVKTLKWESSDPKIATVDQDGTVHGITEGRVTIYAYSADPCCPGVYGSKTLYVGEKFNDMTIYQLDEEGNRIKEFTKDFGIFGYPDETVRIDPVAFATGLGEASFTWMVFSGSAEGYFDFDPATLTLHMKNTGSGEIVATIPAGEAEGDRPMQFIWKVTTKTAMKDIEITLPSRPTDPDDPDNPTEPVDPDDPEAPTNPDEPIGEDNPLKDYTGMEIPLNVNIDPEATNRTVEWESSDISIVEVRTHDSGSDDSEEGSDAVAAAAMPMALMSARDATPAPDCTATLVLKRRGRAIVTAVDPDHRGASFSFPVEVLQHAEQLQLFHEDETEAMPSNRVINGHPRGTANIRTEIFPSNANVNDRAADKRVTYSSAHPTVATVSADGTLTFHGVGRTIITATVADGSGVKSYFTASCTEQPVGGVQFSDLITTASPGDVFTLNTVFTPADATDQRLLWTSSDPSVISVANGVITVLKTGTARITATSLANRKYSTSMSINVVPRPVEKVTLNLGDYTGTPESVLQLTATVEPANATNKALRWSSSDPEVATVDEEGLVKLIAEGTATITVTTTDGTSLNAVCKITVQNAEPEEPTDPNDPTDPTDPTEPENPTDPIDPTDPTDPDEPENPTEPEDPDGPVTGIGTVNGDAVISVSTEGMDIIIEGAPEGMEISVYNTGGALIQRRRADGQTMRITAAHRGVYIVIAGKVYKVSL